MTIPAPDPRPPKDPFPNPHPEPPPPPTNPGEVPTPIIELPPAPGAPPLQS